MINLMFGNLNKTYSISILAKECRKLGKQIPPPILLPVEAHKIKRGPWRVLISTTQTYAFKNLFCNI